MNNRDLADYAFDSCINDELLEKETIVALLNIDPDSDDALYLRKCADKAAHIITENSAYLWGAIGVDSIPCSMNCRFCSFGEAWKLVKNERYFTEAEIMEQVRCFVSEGVRFIVLRTTEFYSIDDLCAKIGRIKSEIPGEYELILNTGEFNLKTAEKMYDSGVSGIYHALRLREGTDTGFAPEDRLATLKAVQQSRLMLISLVEPVGPEHSNEEIADAFMVTVNHDAYVSGTMARVPVKGTPLGNSKMISDNRIAQLTAVFRLASGRKIKNICVHPASKEAVESGANIAVVEMGAVPRAEAFSKKEWNSFAVTDARRLFENAGYDIRHKE